MMNKAASVPGFLTKTYEIFNTPEYQDICSWGPNGDTINIKKIEQFSKHILPKYFKHSNFQSFVRQLNMYDFHKTVQDPSHGEFQHQYFLKDRPELLIYIKRKANNRTAESMKKLSKSSSVTSNGVAVQDSDKRLDDNDDDSIGNLLPDELLVETDTVLTELEQQRIMHFELERKMETKMERLEEENELLKRLFMESNQKTSIMQERMDKVLKTLYTMFAGNPTFGKALLSRIPSLAIEGGPGFSSPKGLITDGNTSSNGNSSSSAAAVLAEAGYYNNNNHNNNMNLNNGDLSLRRMASYDPYGVMTAGMLANGSLAGTELSAANRGTSFDFAAASVSAPSQKYLSSFDKAIFGKPMNGLNMNNNNFTNLNSGSNTGADNSELGVQSDRVTLLSDDSPIKSPPASATSLTQKQQQNSNSSKGQKRNSRGNAVSDDNVSETSVATITQNNNGYNSTGSEPNLKQPRLQLYTNNTSSSSYYPGQYPPSEPIITSPGSSPPSTSGNSNHNNSNNINNNQQPQHQELTLLGPPLVAEELEKIEPQTRDFIDLLNRNQNTTLCRLDSLEQTLATLLEDIEDDGFLTDLPSDPPHTNIHTATNTNHSSHSNSTSNNASKVT